MSCPTYDTVQSIDPDKRLQSQTFSELTIGNMITVEMIEGAIIGPVKQIAEDITWAILFFVLTPVLDSGN